MGSRVEVSAEFEVSNRNLRCRLAELLQRMLFDLPDPLGAEPEIGADPGQRLGRPAETVMAPKDAALALIEPVRETVYDLDLHAVQHVLVVGLRVRVGDRLA